MLLTARICLVRGGCHGDRHVTWVSVQVRTLGAGDALWVARAKGGSHGGPDYVLDTLIERKNCSDLSSVGTLL